MKQPLISIVIAAYNASKTIDRALQSAYMQTYENTEIVVVDDCSHTFARNLDKPYRNPFYAH